MVNPINSVVYAESIVIASGASLSAEINLGGHVLCGVQMPAEWTAAGLTFQASLDGVTYYDLYDDAGTEISVSAAASRTIGFGAVQQSFYVAKFVKVRSGTSGTPVNQAAERTLILALGDPAT